MPLLSLVIPTKNRQKTAVACARTAAGVFGDDVEIVVQDCSDTAALDALLTTNVPDRRIRYEHGPEAVSMTDNYNRAMARARGDYVCFVGDDDAFSPRLRTLAAWAKHRGVPAVSFPHSNYFWPGYPSRLAGYTVVGTCTGLVEMRDARNEIEQIPKRPMPVARLPEIYHGIVRRDVFERMHDDTGTYFDSMCPDYYAAVVAAHYMDSYAYVDYPFTMCGCSPSSNSGRSISGGLSNHLREYAGAQWPEILPEPTDAVLGADSFFAHGILYGLHAARAQDYARLLDLPRFYAAALLREPSRIAPVISRYLHATQQTHETRPAALRALARALGRTLRVKMVVAMTDQLPPTFLRLRGYDLTLARDVVEAMNTQESYFARSGVVPRIGNADSVSP